MVNTEDASKLQVKNDGTGSQVQHVLVQFAIVTYKENKELS